MGGLGAFGRGVPAKEQASAAGSTADAGGHHLAPPQRGATWRALPAVYGPWWRSAQLFIRWSRLGAWQRLLELAQARGVELGLALLDGSVIRAHHKAAGARKRGRATREQRDRREALGRSRGGFGTKACVVADGRGRAVALAVAPGKAHELPLAPGLLRQLPRVPL